jgi:hypothetical protein
VSPRRREVVHRDDGTPITVTKPPRADVLHYPAHDLTTVLVRRTHDRTVARALAEARWAELLAAKLVDQPLGAEDRSVRVGWWTTRGGHQRDPAQAVDEWGRLVTACADTATSAGPGVEFRP